MHNEILPAATDLYRDAARQRGDNYESGTSTLTLVLVLVAGVGMLVARRRAVLRAAAPGPQPRSRFRARRRASATLRLRRPRRAEPSPGTRLTPSRCSSASILTLRAQNNENLGAASAGISSWPSSSASWASSEERTGSRACSGTRQRSPIAPATGRASVRSHRSSRPCAISTRRSGTRTMAVRTRRPSRSRSGRATTRWRRRSARPGQELAAVGELQDAARHRARRCASPAAQDAHTASACSRSRSPSSPSRRAAGAARPERRIGSTDEARLKWASRSRCRDRLAVRNRLLRAARPRSTHSSSASRPRAPPRPRRLPVAIRASYPPLAPLPAPHARGPGYRSILSGGSSSSRSTRTPMASPATPTDSSWASRSTGRDRASIFDDDPTRTCSSRRSPPSRRPTTRRTATSTSRSAPSR